MFQFVTVTGRSDDEVNDGISAAQKQAPKYEMVDCLHAGIDRTGRQVVHIKFKRKPKLRTIVVDSPSAVVTEMRRLEGEHGVLHVELVFPPFRSSSDERQFTALINVYYNR